MHALLGDVTVAAHAKYCKLGDELVVHIEEVIPGIGVMDCETFMRQFQSLAPDGYFIIEHLPDEHVIAVRDNVVALVKRFGVPLAQ